LQRVAACCSVLQRVAACCSVLLRVAACCCVLLRVAVRERESKLTCISHFGSKKGCSYAKGRGRLKPPACAI